MYLAGCHTREQTVTKQPPLYMLESFFYIKPWQIQIMPMLKGFLLDSGAFSFLNGGKSPNYDDYLDRYIEFVRRYNVDRFFELDLDSIVGYAAVLEMRKKLEAKTGKKCIPVWHKSRGYNEFIRMCDNYSYVAIGGIVTKEIQKEQYSVLPKLITEAHKRGCMIHGLGFTSLSHLQDCHFDSVDSTSWLSGSRYGHVYSFNGQTLTSKTPPKGKRTVHYTHIDEHNLAEWLKYQRYAETHL